MDFVPNQPGFAKMKTGNPGINGIYVLFNILNYLPCTYTINLQRFVLVYTL